MKAGTKLCLKLIAVAAALTAVVGVVAFAANAGSETDPLVTVSYLNSTFQKQVESSVSTQIDSTRSTLDSSLASRITSFRNALSTQTSGTAATSAYQTRNLSDGGTLTVNAGAELLFLEGSATVGSTGLTDATTAQAVSTNGSLTVNHLYVASGTCTITASGSAKILVR